MFNIYAIFIIIAGLINLYYSIRFLRNPKFADNYIKNSSKAFLLRKIFGVEKSIKILRKILAPLGILIGILLIFFGILWMVLT